jgi:hypothetical protein
MRAILPTLLLVVVASGALAEPTDPAVTENGRYSMTPVQDGFLRLDTRSGAVAMCRVVDRTPECRLAADERAALESEIGRLSAENKELRTKAASPTNPPAAALPSEHDMDRALSFAERFMRGMMRIMREEGSAPDKTAFSPRSAAPQ